MAAKKRAACWTLVFMCIPSVGSAAVWLDYQPAGTIRSVDGKIIGMGTTDFSIDPLIDPSATLPEKIESLTPVHSTRPAPPHVGVEVAANWYGPDQHNKLTASGQMFDMHKNTLAPQDAKLVYARIYQHDRWRDDLKYKQ